MKRFPWRSILYAVVFLYLLLDLRYCNGPLRRVMMSGREAPLEVAKENQWVAMVNREAITRDQLNLAVFDHLYRRGKRPDEIPEKNLSMIRRAVLQKLIDDTLVRQYADGEKFQADPEEIEAFIEDWESQFSSGEELEERSEMIGLSEEERRKALARVYSRKVWLKRRVSPGVEVTDEEVRAWFDANRETGEGFVDPEKVRARHIFLSTVIAEDTVQEEKIRDLHRQLTEGSSTFEELAAAFSGDERTKKWGGDLNWFARDRVPEDFAEVVFSLKPGELSKPFRTRIGWHIVEVLDRQDERAVDFEEVADGIRSHLENEVTVETIEILMRKLRRASNVRLFPENI